MAQLDKAARIRVVASRPLRFASHAIGEYFEPRQKTYVGTSVLLCQPRHNIALHYHAG